MKFEKIMNTLFYVITTVLSLLFIGFISNQYGIIVGLILFSFYFFSLYCHEQYKEYVIKNNSTEKDNKEPDIAMIEDFYHSLGFTHYNCNHEVDIKDFSEDEIKEALDFYKKIKYGKENKK